MAAINDENESDDSSLTINNSYVVVPTAKSKSNQNNYIVLKSPTKDQLSKKKVRDSLLLYSNKSFKKDEIYMWPSKVVIKSGIVKFFINQHIILKRSFLLF